MYSALWKHTATTPTTHTKRQNDAMGHDVSGETILSTILILFALATLAVIGRFYTRFVLWRDGGVDDWLILTALTWALAMTICEGLQVSYGLGTGAKLLATSLDPNLRKGFWAVIWTYHLAMGFARLSVIMQCLRIFPQASHGWVKWLMWFLAAFNCINMTWAFLSSVMTCVPVQKFWLPDEVDGKCLSRVVLYMTNSALAMVLDFAVAILPIPWIRSLRLPSRQKVLLCGIFILAGFPCVLAAIRVQSLIEVTTSSGSNYTDGILAIFSCSEVYAAIICACLPSLKACWNHLRPKCIRPSHAVCKWLPCSSCEYFSAGSLSTISHRLKLWRQGRRCHTEDRDRPSVNDSRIEQQAGEPHPGQELEVRRPQRAAAKDWAKSTMQTIMEDEGPMEVQWRETGTRVPRLGVLPSMPGYSDPDSIGTATTVGVLPRAAGYSGTTFVNTAGSTERG
ncbi:uncharacterized protein CLAFUR5_04190 [Fulvia fulva]|uniref:Rhodopsin domain-containing protein n=1 Tax=Passalora fulva TaxID=5499 RepID=A0A9Q8LFJ8_PASFU|nr:uncharacterized protein CLAFUR5_04190 [Fulvia fulva]UJO16488.1 hypothetical protein CLAFUR5_04190 [Fulvia fulva]